MRAALLALVLVACGGTSGPTRTSTASLVDDHHGPNGEIVGITSREEIEAELPAWREAREAATIDVDAAGRLRTVTPGATVDVFLGTWCGDSRREVSRLFRALEPADGEVAALPFAIRFVGVDRAKTAPGFTEDVGLRYVPTIVVRRDGHEVGRIVESVPGGVGVERALLELLDGTRTGVTSGRPGL